MGGHGEEEESSVQTTDIYYMVYIRCVWKNVCTRIRDLYLDGDERCFIDKVLLRDKRCEGLKLEFWFNLEGRKRK